MSTLDHFIKKIQPGEAILFQSNDSFEERLLAVKERFGHYADAVILQNSKILIDDIRDWSDDLRKSSMTGFDINSKHVAKIGILVFDEMLVPAQNKLLKDLEDISTDMSIVLFTHTHTVLLPTILSRVIKVYDADIDNQEKTNDSIFPNALYFKKEKNVTKRIERVKKIVENYDEGVISKQDIVVWVESLSQNDERKQLFAEVIVLLKQPSTLVKYVLEFFVGWL